MDHYRTLERARNLDSMRDVMEIKQLRTRCDQLREENQQLRTEVGRIRAENDQLRHGVSQLSQRVVENNDLLRAENDRLRQELGAAVENTDSVAIQSRNQLHRRLIVAMPTGTGPEVANAITDFVGTRIQAERDRLKAELVRLQAENGRLRGENDRLRGETSELRS